MLFYPIGIFHQRKDYCYQLHLMGPLKVWIITGLWNYQKVKLMNSLNIFNMSFGQRQKVVKSLLQRKQETLVQ